MLDIVVTIGIGFVLGFLIGLTGVGGGARVAPALYVILGMSYTGAVAMSLVYSIFTKIVGLIQHMRLGNVDWKLTLAYSLPAIPGAIIGSRALYAVPHLERMFALAMVAVLILVAAGMVAEASVAALASRPKPFDVEHLDAAAIVALSAVAFTVGIMLGITSVGSGSVIILSMVFLFQIPGRQMVGSNIAIALIMLVPAGLTHVLVGGLDGRRLVLMMLGSVVGTMLGSRGTTWLSDRQLKLVIAIVILISATATLIKAW